MSASIGSTFTPGLKLLLGAAGVGLVGGAVAERLLSPSAIEANAAGHEWRAELDGFLEDHPIPGGTGIHVGTKPAWMNYAALAGGSAITAGAGFGLYKLSTKMGTSGNVALGAAGLVLATLGAASLVSSTGSWMFR